MGTAQQTVVHLESISKVFLTEEVETHALSAISLDIGRGDYVSIAGPSGCGKVHSAVHHRTAGVSDRRRLPS